MRPPSDVELIQGEASSFGLRVGYVIPVTLLDDGVGAVPIGGRHIEIGYKERAALGFASGYAIGKFLQLRSDQGCEQTVSCRGNSTAWLGRRRERPTGRPR